MNMLRRHRFLLFLIALDMASKLIALFTLPPSEPVELVGGRVVLYLALNEWGVMGGLAGFDSIMASPTYTVLVAAVLWVESAFLALLSWLRVSPIARTLIGLGAFLGLAALPAWLAPRLPELSPDPETLVFAVRLAALGLAVTLYAVAERPFTYVAFALMAAGAIGNGLSPLYPPFHVIDFVRVPIPAAEGVYGVINFADVCVLGAGVLLLLWPFALVFGALARGVRRRQTVALATRGL